MDDTNPPVDEGPGPLGLAGQAYRQAQEEQRRFDEMVRAATMPAGLAAATSALDQVWAEQAKAAAEMNRIRASFAGVGAIADSFSKSVADQFASIVDVRDLFPTSGLAHTLAKSIRPVFDLPKITTFDEIAAGLGKAWMADVPAFDFPKVEPWVGPDLEPMHRVLDDLLVDPLPGSQVEIAEASRETARAVRDLLGVTEAEQGTLAALTEAVGKLVEVQQAAVGRERERDTANGRRERLRTALTILGLAVSVVGAIYAGLAYRHATAPERPGPTPPATVGSVTTTTTG